MITNPEHKQTLINHFPFLSESTTDFQRVFFNAATVVHISAGHTIADEGSECSQLALVLDGKVRVYKLAAKGREITLYRINEGDSCVLTASCVMSETPFPAIAMAETELDAVVVPANFVRSWVTQYQPWGSFVFGLVTKRLAEVITVLESVTFQRMDVRVAAYLTDKAASHTALNITHHEIAADLGTSREVVSRTLKEFDKHGWISMKRGELIINDLTHLESLAESEN